MDVEDRAEQAFRTALRAHADEHRPTPLTAAGVLAGRPRRGRLVVLAAVAAVLVVFAGGFVVRSLTSHDTATPAGQLPTPDDGWQWTTWGDVAMQVPSDWGYRFPTHSCDRDREAPYIQWASNVAVNANLCEIPGQEGHAPDPFPIGIPSDWQTHAGIIPSSSTLSEAYLGLGTAVYQGWRIDVRRVDDSQVFVMTDPAHRDLADRILGSARTFVTDAHGCGVTSAVEASSTVLPEHPFDLLDVGSVQSIVVCQYGRTDYDRGLEGSVVLHQDEAQTLLDDIQGSPVLDYDAVPFEQCSTLPVGGEMALVLLLYTDDGVRELHGYFNNCVESGFYDGTRRYALTSDTCRAPFAAPPLRLNGFEQSLLPVCGNS
jgi:hypothetical protein